MLYLVEKYSCEHWKTVTLGTDKVRAVGSFDTLCADQPAASFRLVVRRRVTDGADAPAVAVLAERLVEPARTDAPRVGAMLVPLAPVPRVETAPLSAPAARPAPVWAGRWPVRVNPLRVFVYGGLLAGFGIVYHGSLDYVQERMRADGAEPDDGVQTQLVSEAVLDGRSLLGGSAKESFGGGLPATAAVEPEPAADPPVASVPVAGGSAAEPVVPVLTPADAPAATTAAAPVPVLAVSTSPAAPPILPVVSEAATPPAPVEIDPVARAHADCQTDAMRRARFTARPRAKAEFHATRSAGRLHIEGRDLEFRNVFDEWVEVRYACDVDTGTGAVARVEVKARS